jgi:hypothetical protein
MKQSTLTLPLKCEYFDAIQSGKKLEEYRLCTPYWTKRLEGKAYERIMLTLGYPSASDHKRRIVKPWAGFACRAITHPHFGALPVKVFAIDVSGKTESTT